MLGIKHRSSCRLGSISWVTSPTVLNVFNVNKSSCSFVLCISVQQETILEQRRGSPKACYPNHGLIIYRSNFVQVSESRNLSWRAGQHQFRGKQDRLLERLQTPQHRLQNIQLLPVSDHSLGQLLPPEPSGWLQPVVRENLVPRPATASVRP